MESKPVDNKQISIGNQESNLKTDLSFRNTFISWEDINVYSKRSSFFSSSESNDDSQSRRDSLETQTGSSASNNSSIDLNKNKNSNRQILNQGEYQLFLKKDKIKIIFKIKVSGSVKSGELLAIMGAR
jgi:hypothetical protein